MQQKREIELRKSRNAWRVVSIVLIVFLFFTTLGVIVASKGLADYEEMLGVSVGIGEYCAEERGITYRELASDFLRDKIREVETAYG
jgi:cell division protein FtsB